MSDLQIRSALAPVSRAWKTERQGVNDVDVDIWNPETGNWIPAFFSDIRKGDFYLLIGVNLEPGRCFVAGSDVRNNGGKNPTFVILGGAEIGQAPAMKDVPALDGTTPRLEMK